MRTIDVCLSPDLMHLYDVHDRTVVIIDILRATSCMTTAFAHGVDSIRTFASLADCLSMKELGYVTAGERDGKKVDGFDKGNSPFEYMDGMEGARIAFTTTNGTQAIAKSAGAREIVIGSFLNLSAVANHLIKGEHNVLAVCSGWKGKVNLEDTLYAGALVHQLRDHVTAECDAPEMAERLFESARQDLMTFLQDSSHVRRLARLGIERDIRFCLTTDQYAVVPVLVQGVLTCAPASTTL